MRLTTGEQLRADIKRELNRPTSMKKLAELLNRCYVALGEQQDHEGPDYGDGPEFEGWAERSGQQAHVPDGAESFDTPAEFLAYKLVVKRSEVLGRPLTWRESIELIAITTNMPDADKAKLLALDDAAPSEPAAQGWVPVSEGLPESATDVLVYGINHGSRSYTVAGIFSGEWASQETEEPTRFEPTHWMPLPKCPEVGHE